MGTIELIQAQLKQCLGTASRIQTIFDYHYDAIMREVEQELSKHPKKEEVMDLFTELMEYIWPVAQGDFTTDMED